MTTENPEIKHGKKAVHDQESANQKTFDDSVLKPLRQRRGKSVVFKEARFLQDVGEKNYRYSRDIPTDMPMVSVLSPAGHGNRGDAARTDETAFG